MKLGDRTLAARGLLRGMSGVQRQAVSRVCLLLADGNYSELGHSLHELGTSALAMEGLDTRMIERRVLTPAQAAEVGSLAIIEPLTTLPGDSDADVGA